MYLKKAVLTNIRSIDALEWELPSSAPTLAGWHVIIGDNGAGKSSVLRAIALGLVGPYEALALRQDWSEWLRWGAELGSIALAVERDAVWDRFFESERSRSVNDNFPVELVLNGSGSDREQVIIGHVVHGRDAEHSIWGGAGEIRGKSHGWFCASYGPFRRFTGGDKDQERLFVSNPLLSRHLSVFGESVALTECLEWLKLLQFKKLEGGRTEGELLDSLKQFINQPDFLPHEARLESISSNGVRFVDGNGCEVPVENLSDGYRSILSMTFELIRQLVRTYGAENIFVPGDPTTIQVPGIVLIDEVDAHLHPTWQRRVGHWFRQHFPKLQFIVTTHSPLICQAATVGSIFRLPRPGSEERGGMVTGTARDRLLYGNVLDAYSTGAFGEVLTRSPEALEQLERLAILNQKELAEGLTEDERAEQQKLRERLPTATSALPSSSVEVMGK